MKRSDFLEHLYKRVDEFMKNPTDENLVDYIIKQAERMGMKPPNAKFPNPYSTTDDQGNVYPGNSLDRNEWEPEDEA